MDYREKNKTWSQEKEKKICTFIPLEWERPKAGIPSKTNADWTILQGSWLSPYLPRLEILHKTLCRFFLQCRLEPDTSNSGTSLSFSLFTYFYSRFTNIEKGEKTKQSINIHGRQAPGFNTKFPVWKLIGWCLRKNDIKGGHLAYVCMCTNSHTHLQTHLHILVCTRTITYILGGKNPDSILMKATRML